MDNAQVVAALIGMSVVTAVPRVLPLLAFGQRELPQWFRRFLSHIPVAILSALLFQSLFIVDDKIVISVSNPLVLAAVPTLVVAYFTRSLYLTVVVGLAGMALLRFAGIGT